MEIISIREILTLDLSRIPGSDRGYRINAINAPKIDILIAIDRIRFGSCITRLDYTVSAASQSFHTGS